MGGEIYKAPDGSLWHGHVIEVLSQLAESSVDLVVTSPPY